ncbi:TlpA family protein disulfide reductase [Spongiibacter nanhainus]|uniref:TlpA family protein disulfide reductase n=1 Tax=Spongiibacter nanhainus TaxID=2794344 RepID=A0A7T4R1M3_9GAMM|nr:TlpA disulfide reductase family protein [Spongiibacter nanhainus]QQD18604.1 TlpA family protein disulfide reductase [Spongiibacter nanhainus]
MKRRLVFLIIAPLILWAAGLSQAALASTAAPMLPASGFNLDDYRGKVVYLDFWASWCGPCRASFPYMNTLVSRYGNDLAVVTINLDEDADSARSFIDQFKPSFPVFHDPSGHVAQQFQVAGMPNSFLFDRRGQLLLKHIGFTKSTPEKLDSAIQRAIQP